MVRRLLLVQGSPELCDDKDYIGNKRAEAAGQMLALLFEDLFKKFNTELKKEIDATIKKYTVKGMDYDVTKLMNTNSITLGLVNSLSSGNWTVKRFKVEKKGVTQVLNRLSYIAAIGMMTRMESHIEKSRKVSGPRALQPSHWGMLCPSDTPDGENCGLVKSLALLAHITTETSEIPVFNLLLSLGLQEISQFSGLEIHSGRLAIVFLNGTIVGIHSKHQQLLSRFKEYRRQGRIGQFVSINYDKVNNFVNVMCDYGRLCRPYVIVKQGVPLLTREHVRKVESKEIDFEALVKQGIIEYMDVNEEDNSYIAMYEHEVNRSLQDRAGDHAHRDSSLQSAGAGGRRDSLSSPQSESAKHLPVRDGQASHWSYRTEPVLENGHSALSDRLPSKAAGEDQDDRAHELRAAASRQQRHGRSHVLQRLRHRRCHHY